MVDRAGDDESGCWTRWHCGCSFFLPPACSPIALVPVMDGLRRRLRHIAMPAPRIQAVVDNEFRQKRQSLVCGAHGSAIGGRARQQLPGCFHDRALREGNLMTLDELAAPRIDLFMNVDL